MQEIPNYLYIIKGASRKHIDKFLEWKKPYVMASWERYIKNSNESLKEKEN